VLDVKIQDKLYLRYPTGNLQSITWSCCWFFIGAPRDGVFRKNIENKQRPMAARQKRRQKAI